MIRWHRFFGLGLVDYFTGTRYSVELEKDLSIKQQLLDVVIIEQGEGQQIDEPADGLENLARHNLMTYKSLHQPLDCWALEELIGHYANYRKLLSSSLQETLPGEDFALFAIATRHPEKLEAKVALESITEGVYEVQCLNRRIRVIVLSEVVKVERNSLWLLYSGIAEMVRFGALKYRWRRRGYTRAMNKLFKSYNVEGIAMPYTWEDFEKESREELLAELTPEEILKALPLEKLLKGLPTEERLKGLPPEEILKHLPPEEILKHLTREQIEAYLKKLLSSQ